MSDGIPFIPNALDDHGLSPGEFRVFCHIARRGECFASIPSMARVCRMDAKTVKRAIKTLAEGGLLRREFRLGETLKLSVAPPGEWTPPRPKDTPGCKRVWGGRPKDTRPPRPKDTLQRSLF